MAVPPRGPAEAWIPNNEILERDGVSDTPEAAPHLPALDHRRRGARRAHRHLPAARARDAVVRPANSPLKLCWVPNYPTTTRRAPAVGPDGRSVEPKPFDAKKLGSDLAGLEPPYGKVPLNVVVMQQDYVRLNQLKRHPRGVLRSLGRWARGPWAQATGKNLVGMGGR